MATTITRRLRLQGDSEIRDAGKREAAELLAALASTRSNPATQLSEALGEIIGLATENRIEESAARLEGFCEVIGPVLMQTPEVKADKGPARQKRLTMRESNAAYGAGCSNGHKAADAWLSNPLRGNPKHGGTLQTVVLDLAERMRHAQGEEEILRIRGEIVGFCYRIECPAGSIACEEVMAKKEQQGAKS